MEVMEMNQELIRRVLRMRAVVFIFGFVIMGTSYAQQDPNYTQYMYNTMSINPAYAGSKEVFSAAVLSRSQWVGVEGAPKTQSLSFHFPVNYSGVGIGMNVINDKLGPSQEVYFDGNISYTVRTSTRGNLAFGMRLGGRLLSLDWSKGIYKNPNDVVFNQNINSKFLPTLGAGLYYHTAKFYLGISVPNLLRTEHYNDFIESTATERLHYFGIIGYVFDVNDNLKFKPSAITKVVSGAPLSFDASANFLFYDKVTLGFAYRWGDSMSGLFDIKVFENLNIGYAYDLTTSNYRNYNSGTHEVILRFEVAKGTKLKSPRFF